MNTNFRYNDTRYFAITSKLFLDSRPGFYGHGFHSENALLFLFRQLYRFVRRFLCFSVVVSARKLHLSNDRLLSPMQGSPEGLLVGCDGTEFGVMFPVRLGT